MNMHCICFVVPQGYAVFSDRSVGPIGGAEIQQMLMAKALVKVGHDVHVIVKDHFYKQDYQWCGVNVHPCKFRYLLKSNLYFIPDTIKLIHLMRKIKADFNLLKTPTSILFAMGLHRKIFGGKLIKLMAHDRDCFRSDKGIVSHLYPIGVKFLDYTVFQSKYQLVEGKKGLDLKGAVIKNIAHGEIEAVSRDKDIEVLWVGSCIKRKQPEVFVKLAQKLPELNFKMVLSKTDNNPLADSLLKEIGEMSNIENLGQIKHEKIGEIYSRTKLLVSTSESDGEGFPNTFLQAWQFGVPVVSLNVNPDNIITENEIGIVSGSIDKMINDVNLLLSDDLKREKLGSNTVKYMKSNHSEEVIVKRLNEVFEELTTECS